MKRILFLSLFLAVSLSSAFSQNTLSSIRQRYALMKEYIASHQGDNQYDGADWGNWYYLKVRQWLPATAGHVEDVYMYYGEGETDEGEVYAPHYLKFLTTSFNNAARKYYQEYLYDADGSIAFIYAYDPMTSLDGDDAEEEYELRFYFDKGKLLRAIIKRKAAGDESFREVFAGKALPQAYSEELEMLQASARKYHQLFTDIDGKVY